MTERHLLAVIAVALAALAASSIAGGAVGVRAPARGPEGGDVVALAIDPRTPTTLYAGTEGAGVFKSTDGGRTWGVRNVGLPWTWIHALAVDPLRSAHVYVGTDWGVYKSTDGGRRWKASRAGLPGAPIVLALAIDPRSPSTVYAGTQSHGIFKTVDGGRMWRAVSPRGLGGITFHSLAVGRATSGRPGTVYAGAEDRGIFTSSDGGRTWRPAKRVATAYRVTALAVDPRNPALVYAGMLEQGNVLRSIDGGRTWRVLELTDGLIPDVWAIAIDVAAPKTVYVGTDRGLFKTTNRGASWQPLGAGLGTRPVRSLAIARQTRATYAGTLDGVFQSVDGGRGWKASSSGLTAQNVRDLAVDPHRPSAVYAATQAGGVFSSFDGARTWRPAASGSVLDPATVDVDVDALAVDPRVSGTVYAGMNWGYGVYKSTDGGRRWRGVNRGLGPRTVDTLAVDPNRPETLYAGTAEGVFKTTDGGRRWRAFSAGLPRDYVNELAIDPRSSTSVYAGLHRNGVFKSTDGGKTWRSASAGLPSAYGVGNLALDPRKPSTVYVSGRGGLFKSANGGRTWRRLGLPGGVAAELAVHPRGSTVYAAVGSRVFRRTEDGGSWRPLARARSTLTIASFAFAADGRTLYVGTVQGGVYRLAIRKSG